MPIKVLIFSEVLLYNLLVLNSPINIQFYSAAFDHCAPFMFKGRTRMSASKIMWQTVAIST